MQSAVRVVIKLVLVISFEFDVEIQLCYTI